MGLEGAWFGGLKGRFLGSLGIQGESSAAELPHPHQRVPQHNVPGSGCFAPATSLQQSHVPIFTLLFFTKSTSGSGLFKTTEGANWLRLGNSSFCSQLPEGVCVCPGLWMKGEVGLVRRSPTQMPSGPGGLYKWMKQAFVGSATLTLHY